ncbi:unnamed protein product [Paramecium primaurelia]|uniref:diacylglycerol O-acyltransferase n=1 Tax=Paramecium primaurelia TaxID=5886 RepID=A0A8S1QCS8_PARPR|nr:unnamed protein product [Paramecium primaurelia]
MARPIKSIIGTLLYQIWIVLMGISIYLIYRAVTQDYWLIPILLGFIVFQSKVQKSNLFVQFLKSLEVMKFFNKNTIQTLEKVRDKNVIFAFHPHGIYSYSTISNTHTPGTFFENMVLLGSNMALLFPIAGLFLKFYGIQGANPDNFKKLLSSGAQVGLLPGGFEEATMTSPKENRIFIKQRKGFIYYALKYGTIIYPVFVFGENTLFNTIDWFLPLRLWLNKFKLAGTVFWSRFLTIPEPNREIHTICGKGIVLPQIEKPSREDVEKYHQIYIQAVKDLYDQYAPLYAKGIPLKIY